MTTADYHSKEVAKAQIAKTMNNHSLEINKDYISSITYEEFDKRRYM